ncbi:MAG: VF530 family DNA-binding protein [Gallionellaceae bacterium]|nr:VF530 family DNA-binding protein [Gallionellaceae bacterium]
MAFHGWPELGRRIDIRCFSHDPSIFLPASIPPSHPRTGAGGSYISSASQNGTLEIAVAWQAVNSDPGHSRPPLPRPA